MYNSQSTLYTSFMPSDIKQNNFGNCWIIFGNPGNRYDDKNLTHLTLEKLEDQQSAEMTAVLADYP